MDIFVLLATMFVCFVIGVPIAYSLALAAIAGAIWIGIPLEARDAEDLRRREQGRDADHPVLRAGRRHHGRGRHGAAPGRLRRRAGRLHARARRPLGRQRAGDHVSQRHFRLVGRRHLGDRLGDDPADGEGRLSARVRHQRDDHRLGAGAAGAAEPQRGDLFAGDRRHDLDHQPVHGRRRAGPAARLRASSSCASSSPIATAIRAARRCRCATRSRSPSRRCGA